MQTAHPAEKAAGAGCVDGGGAWIYHVVRQRANAVAIVLVAFVAAVAVVAAVAHSAYPGLDNVSEKARCCVVVVYRTFLLIVPCVRVVTAVVG